MMQDPAKHLQFRTQAGVTVVGFTSSYLNTEDAIEKIGNELMDLLEHEGTRKVLLTFSGVRFMSSSMLAQVVKLHKRLGKEGGKLRVSSLTPEMRQVLHASQLDRMLDVYDDEPAALAKF